MNVVNIHRRRIGSAARLGTLLDNLAGDRDLLWPGDRWPPLRLDRGLEVGARGGHGPVCYRVVYRPLHDALIEDALDNAEREVRGRPLKSRPWSLYVKALRWAITRTVATTKVRRLAAMRSGAGPSWPLISEVGMSASGQRVDALGSRILPDGGIG